MAFKVSAGRDDGDRRQLRHQRCAAGVRHEAADAARPDRRPGRRAPRDLRLLGGGAFGRSRRRPTPPRWSATRRLRAGDHGSLDREASGREIAAMQTLLREALDAGAIGLSTGTFYPPALKASTARDHRGRPAADAARRHSTSRTCATSRRKVMEALDETFRIGRELAIPVVMSASQGAEPAELRPFRGDARLHPRDDERGRASASTAYPYTAGSTMIRTDRGMLDGRVLIASKRAASGVRRPRARRRSPPNGASRKARRRGGCSRAPRSTS